MKKRILGVVVTALLLGSSIGYAASSSLIGAKVTGIFTIEQDGNKIADAVVINGSTYAPVRAISEATNTELKVEGKTIMVESKQENQVTQEKDKTGVIIQLSQKLNTLARNETQIENLKNIQREGYANEATSAYYKYETTESFAKTTAEIERLTKENVQLRSEIPALQAELNE